MNSIRVLIADDHTLVRAGMRALLGQVPEVEVIAEASEGREALHLVATHQPDVVLMDITMPGLNGLEATVRVAKEYPRARDHPLDAHRRRIRLAGPACGGKRLSLEKCRDR